MTDDRPEARVATTEDRSAVITTIVRAFSSDPLVRWFFPDDNRYRVRASAFFGYLFDIRVADGGVILADGAASLWTPPGGGSTSRGEQDRLWGTQVEPGAGPGEIERLDAFDEVVDSFRPPGSHWYLGVLGTDPERRGLGLARAVLEPRLALADRDGVPTFLETATPDNLPFYERFGFGVLAEAPVPDGPSVWGLWRPAR